MLDSLLLSAAEAGYSDFIISAGKHSSFRYHGKLVHDKNNICTEESIVAFRNKVLTDALENTYLKNGAVDASYSAGNFRFRINFYDTLSGPSMVVRPIRSADGLSLKISNCRNS